jgi:L-aspartate oxidase
VPETSFDLLVIGSGAAGLAAALRAADLGAHNVAVLTAGAPLAGSSPRAQGGVAAAVGADDTPSLHAQDTLQVGAGLNDARAVSVLTAEGKRSVTTFREVFADDLGLEAGHARRRILHAGGGATGQVLTSALLERALAHPRIALYENTPVSSLILEAGRVTGVRTRQGEYRAPAVVLATGGYGALWGRSTNAPETRGTGHWLAWNAGATLADLEFVQFHPTALAIDGRPSLLLSEALRGEGALLLDEHDHPIVDPLLPRDVVARALHRHLKTGHQAFLSLRHLPPERIHANFTTLAGQVRATAGLDLARDPLPVAPAAHYCMGGIRTDLWGRTDVPGLYAAGEAACSGAQGANRLASNSLLECLVFGARTAEAALRDTRDAAAIWSTRALPASRYASHDTRLTVIDRTPPESPYAADDTRIPPIDRPLRESRHASHHTRIAVIDPAALGTRLDADVGVERAPHRLERLIAELPTPDAAPSSDLLLASLVARAAFLRRESRGAHFRTDFPESDPAWRGRLHWRRGQTPVFEEVLPS